MPKSSPGLEPLPKTRTSQVSDSALESETNIARWQKRGTHDIGVEELNDYVSSFDDDDDDIDEDVTTEFSAAMIPDLLLKKPNPFKTAPSSVIVEQDKDDYNDDEYDDAD